MTSVSNDKKNCPIYLQQILTLPLHWIVALSIWSNKFILTLKGVQFCHFIISKIGTFVQSLSCCERRGPKIYSFTIPHKTLVLNEHWSCCRPLSTIESRQRNAIFSKVRCGMWRWLLVHEVWNCNFSKWKEYSNSLIRCFSLKCSINMSYVPSFQLSISYVVF